MDPEYQHDATFASTLSGINELRARYAGDDNEDWKRYKLTFVNLVRAGEKLEREFQGVQQELAKAARAAVVAKLISRIEFLEWESKANKGLFRRAGGFIVQIGLVILAGYMGHVWK